MLPLPGKPRRLGRSRQLRAITYLGNSPSNTNGINKYASHCYGGNRPGLSDNLNDQRWQLEEFEESFEYEGEQDEQLDDNTAYSYRKKSLREARVRKSIEANNNQTIVLFPTCRY